MKKEGGGTVMTMKVVIVEETRKDPEFVKVQHHHAIGDIGAYGTESSE